MKFKLLVADDEVNIRRGLGEFLEEEGYLVLQAENGKQALEILEKEDVDLVITDLRMAPISGEQLMQRVFSKYPTVPVIVLTGHGTVEAAVEAMHKGAYDFLAKPIDLNRLLLLIRRALRTRELALRNREIQQELEQRESSRQLFSKSKAMQRIQEIAQSVAPTNASVLITGESGVGKEVLCDMLHSFSLRKDGPLIKVHCAALSESLLESELFGHERGAFTGAVAQKKGRFELADGGTIFLDEIGEINQGTQVKLLRVLQEQSFERVGGEKTVKVDVRCIAATNKNLYEEVEKGNFREDLFYRLSVVNIEIPPLRDRREDIILLAHMYLKTFVRQNNKNISGFDKKAMQLLMQYDWPGNIRQLRNTVESAVVLAQADVIGEEDLPDAVRRSEVSDGVSIALGSSLKEAEKEFIRATLGFCGWNKNRAAEMLGIGRKTLYNKMDEYGIAKSGKDAAPDNRAAGHSSAKKPEEKTAEKAPEKTAANTASDETKSE